MKKKSLKTTDCRVIAADVIVSVLNHHKSFSKVLPDALERVQEKDRALLQDICYGSLRHSFSLRHQINKQLNKPLKEKDSDILGLMLIGAYQLLHTRIPAYATINSCVNAAAAFNKPWAKGLINAVLRNLQREMAATENSGQQKDSVTIVDEVLYDHPQWLIDKIKIDHGLNADAILRANNSKAPITLRVNRQRIARSDYLRLLTDNSILAHPTKLSSDGLQLETATNVSNLPLFSDGGISIQDEAAQLSATLLTLSKKMSVLDACAAPGGKTCHMLEIEPNLAVTALAINERRNDLIRQNLSRLRLSAQVITADASRPETWWRDKCNGEYFDRILVDAPCSATGVIRHHPDIKALRKASDIPNLAKTQTELLFALWPLLKPNGILLYVTCSILSQENDDVILQFLKNTPDASLDIINAEWGIKTTYGRQLLPQKDGHDGFYFSRIKKKFLL